ncbi:hypothetical protein [Cytobacillus oceanisediminis]|uniref:hypothetical protein n=1 Tax=Cytobacillus oceanisediminis TaxID=665099 RepID=UPI003734CFB7
MNNGIIDDVESLMSLTEEELTEKLLEDKYNKANLRELIKRTIDRANTYKIPF